MNAIRFWVLAVCIIVLGIQPVRADDPGIPRRLIDLVAEGIDLTLKQHYDQADSVIQIVTEKYPGHPLGYLYSAAVMEARSMDYLDPLDFGKFDSLLALAKSGAKKIIDQSPDSPLGYYYLGTAIGYDAYVQVDAGNWLGGIVRGLSAATEFKKSIELDSTFYDAYVGVGTYYYWKSRKVQFLNWVLGDHRAEGIRLLKIAVDKAAHNRFAALSVLTAIYLDTGQYNLSVECAKRALDRYPDNRIFLGELAEAQEQSGDFGEVIQTYERLLSSIRAASIQNPYSEIACRMHLVKAKLTLKQTEGLKSQIDAILAYEHHVFPQSLTTKAKDKFEQARNLRQQLVDP